MHGLCMGGNFGNFIKSIDKCSRIRYSKGNGSACFADFPPKADSPFREGFLQVSNIGKEQKGGAFR